jgi:hypothetical protein
MEGDLTQQYSAAANLCDVDLAKLEPYNDVLEHNSEPGSAIRPASPALPRWEGPSPVVPQTPLAFFATLQSAPLSVLPLFLFALIVHD